MKIENLQHTFGTIPFSVAYIHFHRDIINRIHFWKIYKKMCIIFILFQIILQSTFKHILHIHIALKWLLSK